MRLAQQVHLPIVTASSSLSEQSLYEAIDGRLWFFPEIPHGWSPAEDASAGEDWFAVDLRKRATIGSVEVSFLEEKDVSVPSAVRLQVREKGTWTDVKLAGPIRVLANGVTRIATGSLSAQELRLVLRRGGGKPARLIAFRVFAPEVRHARGRV